MYFKIINKSKLFVLRSDVVAVLLCFLFIIFSLVFFLPLKSAIGGFLNFEGMFARQNIKRNIHHI